MRERLFDEVKQLNNIKNLSHFINRNRTERGSRWEEYEVWL